MTIKHAVIAGVALALAAPAGAQMVSAKDPQTVVAALQAKGYKAELGETAGDPHIKSGAGGVQFTIFFQNCSSGRNCTTITFATGFTDIDATLAKLNEWNQGNRFARAYLDSDQDPVLRMDVDLDHQGLSRANFGEYLDIWGSLAPKYLNFLRGR